MKQSYTVKNYLWLAIILMSLIIVLLSGCSSAPTKTAQFCNTSKTIQVNDGSTVSSKTTVRCSDDFVERHVPARIGVDQNCRPVVTQYGRNYVCETHTPGRYVYISDPANLSN
jgi:ABC-type Fe3+-hydroxamate transport system substrate-binding protein